MRGLQLGNNFAVLAVIYMHSYSIRSVTSSMALKINTKKILLCLFATELAAEQGLELKELRACVSTLSETGVRSLIVLLEKKKLLFKKRVFGKTTFLLTEQGREAVKVSFPAVNYLNDDWDGRWMGMTFLNAPKSDTNFRFLRELVLAERALPLARGFYIKAGGFSEAVLSEVKARYLENVALFWVDTWIVGLDRPLVYKYYDLNAVAESLSGISNQVDDLLTKIEPKKRLIERDKKNIYTAVDRLMGSLREDSRLLRHYFPEVPEALNILSKVGRVLLL